MLPRIQIVCEMFEDKDPFLCLEVDKNTPLHFLCKRFDALFPDRIIRLIIDKQYTPIFYLGKQMFLYKGSKSTYECKSPSPPPPMPDFQFKMMFDQPVEELLEDQQKKYLDSIGLNLNKFKVMRDLHLYGEEYRGLAFSNGTIHVFDQYLFSDVEGFLKQFRDFLPFTTVFNGLNTGDTGYIVIETLENILGETND